MWIATIQLAVRNLLLHKLRSFLTVLGTILGVASVIAMLSVGEGSKQEAVNQIRKLGAQNIMVRSVKPSGDAGSNAVTSASTSQVLAYGLKYSDLSLLTETIPTLKTSVPIAVVRKNVQRNSSRITNARILGTTSEYLTVRNLYLARGRFLNQRDIDSYANVVVLSEGAALKLFRFQDPLSQTVLIGEGAYVVVGVLGSQSTGTATAGEFGQDNLNEDLYIPISSARSRFGVVQRIVSSGSRSFERNELSEITLAVTDEDQVTATADVVRSLLQKSHPYQQDYEVVVPLELLEQAEREKRIWNIVLGSIAGISLLVGGIGIMNIMLATVTERTREIGIRRAIGAKRSDIIRQFLIETTVLSTIGGMVGIVLGVSIPWLVTTFAGIPTSTSLWSVFLAFGISVAIGIIFGVYPARKAAYMNPIEALRHQ